MYTNHGPWVCKKLAWLKHAKTFIATHDLWPEGASMPQTDCIIGLRSKYHPATHQPQPFQTPNHLELHACVKVMNVVSSLHDPNFTTARSMAWFQSAAPLFTIRPEYAEYAEASAWQFRHHIARPCHLHIRNHERVQKENRHGLITLTMPIHCNPSKSLKPSNEVDIQKKYHSTYILEDTQSNLHQFTCPGEITSL